MILPLLIALAGPIQGATPAPSSATDAGAEVWTQLVEATRGPGIAQGPVTALEIEADVRARQPDGQNNDIRPHFRYLEPGYVHVRLQSGRETGKGPAKRQRDAYWMRDGDTILPLKGREHATDRAELDQMLAINRMLLVLLHPERLGIRDLHGLRLPPRGTQERTVGRELAWVTFRTSQLGLTASAANGTPAEQQQQQEVAIGVDRASGLPRQAQVVPIVPAGEPAPQPPRFYTFDDFVDSSGFRLPRKIRVYDLGSDGRHFKPEPTLDVFVHRADLRPELTPEMFLPE